MEYVTRRVGRSAVTWTARRAAALAALVLLALAQLGASATPVGAAELILFERTGCPWCARWLREVGPAYPNTEEGRLAPLRRINLDEGHPSDLQLSLPVRFSPTFVLVHEGREVGRIVGYMDAATFWGLYSRMIEDFRKSTGKAREGDARSGRSG
jgi:hypothetical protein